MTKGKIHQPVSVGVVKFAYNEELTDDCINKKGGKIEQAECKIPDAK